MLPLRLPRNVFLKIWRRVSFQEALSGGFLLTFFLLKCLALLITRFTVIKLQFTGVFVFIFDTESWELEAVRMIARLLAFFVAL